MPNTITLEQLDQFGTLDSLPFSLDNNWTDEGICGPFNLEQLDQFNTNLDAIQISLDSIIWDTACIKLERGLSFTGTGSLTVSLPEFITAEADFTGVGTLTSAAVATRTVEALINGTGTLTSASTRERHVDGQISGTGSLTSGGIRERLVAGDISGDGTLVSASTRTRTVNGAILGTGELTANARTLETFFTDAHFTGVGTLDATAIIAEPITIAANITGSANVTANIGITYSNNTAAFFGEGTLTLQLGNVFDVVGNIVATSSVSAAAYIYGEEWRVVTDDVNTWTEMTAETNTWSEITAESNQWQLRA